MSDWDPECPCGNDSQCTRCGAGTDQDQDRYCMCDGGGSIMHEYDPVKCTTVREPDLESTTFEVVERPGTIVSGQVQWDRHLKIVEVSRFADGRTESRDLAWFAPTDIGRRLADILCDRLIEDGANA